MTLVNRQVAHAARVIRIELQRAKEREPRLIAKPLHAVRAAECEVRGCERWIDARSRQREGDGFIHVLRVVVVSEKEDAVGQPGLRGGESRVEVERFPEQRDGLEVPPLVHHAPHFIRAQVQLIGLCVVRRPPLDPPALVRREVRRQRPGHAQRDIALNREHVR